MKRWSSRSPMVRPTATSSSTACWTSTPAACAQTRSPHARANARREACRARRAAAPSYNPPMDEFALIARHFTRTPRDPGTVLGVGDDAAILDAGADREWLATVDMMVEGRHF